MPVHREGKRTRPLGIIHTDLRKGEGACAESSIRRSGLQRQEKEEIFSGEGRHLAVLIDVALGERGGGEGFSPEGKRREIITEWRKRGEKINHRPDHLSLMEGRDRSQGEW